MPDLFSQRGPISEFAETSLNVEVLSPQDVTPMLDLFSRAIPHTQLRRSIYLARGVERYLTYLMQYAGLQGQEQMWGLKDESHRLLAAAHSRTFHSGSHLNNCAVDPEIQGFGLGSRMLKYWESMAQSQGASALTLDVADENAGAQRLYLRHGFREESVTHEFRLQELPQSSEWTGLLLQNWPQALASLEVFGFGRFHMGWNARAFQVDLLPDQFRIYTPEERIIVALHQMDAHRAILLRHSNPMQQSVWSPTGAIIRMIKELA